MGRLTIVLVLAVATASCQGSDFSGTSPRGPGPTVAQGGTAPCQDATQINSKIQSKTFANGSPGNKIQYQLNLAGCDGTVRPIPAGSLLFDVDVSRQAETIQNGLDFILSIGRDVITGHLTAVQGKDLFGNEGPNLFFYKNDRDLAFATQNVQGTLVIDFKGERIFPREGTIKDGPFSFGTYLKFGPAAPVKHVLFAE